MRSKSAVSPLLALLVSSLALSGCTSDGGDVLEDFPSPSDTPTTSPTDPGEEPEEEPEDCAGSFHTHPYWKGPYAVLFEEFQIELAKEQLYYEPIPPQVLVGFKEFTFEDDGDADENSVKSDTVYQGTGWINFTFTWEDNPPQTKIPGLRFFYRHANGLMTAYDEIIESGQEYTLTLGERWADLAHQQEVSRWRFRIEAFDPTMGDEYPIEAHAGIGTVELSMKAYNGGETLVDEPHPCFFTEGTSLGLGTIDINIADECVMVNNTKSAFPEPVEAVRPERPQNVVGQCNFVRYDDPYRPEKIVPWETTSLQVDLYYNVTPVGNLGHKFGLTFHGADDDLFLFPPVEEEGEGWARYVISIPDNRESMTDSPYATSSDWAFGVYPRINDEDAGAAIEEADFQIHLTAFKDGDTSARGGL